MKYDKSLKISFQDKGYLVFNNFFSKENEYSYIFVFAFDSNDRVIERKVLNLNELQKTKMNKIETENNIIQRGLIEKIFGGVGTQKVPITD